MNCTGAQPRDVDEVGGETSRRGGISKQEEKIRHADYTESE